MQKSHNELGQLSHQSYNVGSVSAAERHDADGGGANHRQTKYKRHEQSDGVHVDLLILGARNQGQAPGMEDQRSVVPR
ncbi:hypothetical protein [Streptomyces sp. NPDC002889]|uniref:hypothetical protein n=1 Tax=Streptomyces sp. NPDC002889 TaxID=3364669 RepID=UPI0036CE2701